MILKINTSESAKQISNLYSKTTLIYNTNTTKKEFHDSVTISQQYIPDVSFHKDSLYPRIPEAFHLAKRPCLLLNRNMLRVYRWMCVHIQLYIYTNIYALTQCNKHRRTQTPAIPRQSSSPCFPLVPTVPRIFSSKQISFHVINIISRQQATSACKAKKDYMFQCKCRMMVQLSRCSYKEGNKYD